jgi:hypothetical protein
MEDLAFQPGDESFVAEDSPCGQYSAVFEDDGETGYFYAMELIQPDNTILDAVHIYTVGNVVDREKPSALAIAWSADGFKCALIINGYAHAAFDFALQRGYCRTNFPNFPAQTPGGWAQSGHAWSDEAVAWL